MSEVAARVLVIEDEKFYREVIVETLSDAGIPSLAPASADDALKAVESHPVGAVVLGVGLAGLAGIDLISQLHALRPAVQVIVLGTAAEQEQVLEALRRGACDYLVKPLHDEELVLVVKRALANFDAHEGLDGLRDRLAALRSQLSELTSCLCRDEGMGVAAISQRAARAIAVVLRADRTSLMLLDPTRALLRVVGATGTDLPFADLNPVAVGDSLAGLALESPLVVRDTDSDPRTVDRAPRSRYRTRSFAIAPLASVQGNLGVVCVSDRRPDGPFDEHDLVVLRVFGLHVAQLLLARGAGDAGRVSAVAPGEGLILPGAGVQPLEEVELMRRICEAVSMESEPERVLNAALVPVAQILDASPVSLYLFDERSHELRRDAQIAGQGPGDRLRLPTAQGLVGTVLETGRPIATDQPEHDPRFDPAVDTPDDGSTGPILCVPLRLRGRVLGVARAFPRRGSPVTAATAELLCVALSAAIRSVLLYRSLVEAIDEVAQFRRES